MERAVGRALLLRGAGSVYRASSSAPQAPAQVVPQGGGIYLVTLPSGTSVLMTAFGSGGVRIKQFVQPPQRYPAGTLLFAKNGQGDYERVRQTQAEAKPPGPATALVATPLEVTAGENGENMCYINAPLYAIVAFKELMDVSLWHDRNVELLYRMRLEGPFASDEERRVNERMTENNARQIEARRQINAELRRFREDDGPSTYWVQANYARLLRLLQKELGVSTGTRIGTQGDAQDVLSAFAESLVHQTDARHRILDVSFILVEDAEALERSLRLWAPEPGTGYTASDFLLLAMVVPAKAVKKSGGGTQGVVHFVAYSNADLQKHPTGEGRSHWVENDMLDARSKPTVALRDILPLGRTRKRDYMVMLVRANRRIFEADTEAFFRRVHGMDGRG